MKNRSALEKLGDFILGRGFYIVLFLCVATIGISGYYLIRGMGRDVGGAEPAGGGASVTLPDSEANAPDPAGSFSPWESVQDDPALSVKDPAPAPEQPDDPAPVKRPEPALAEEPETPRPVASIYTWPVKGEVLRSFTVDALAPDPTMGDWRTHGGLDVSAPVGVEVLAMGAGVVTEIRDDDLMGACVTIDHGNGLVTTYANLAGQPTVAVDDPVEPGAVIGAVGTTAIAESGMPPHLHLEAVFHGEPVDPLEYLPQR